MCSPEQVIRQFVYISLCIVDHVDWSVGQETRDLHTVFQDSVDSERPRGGSTRDVYTNPGTTQGRWKERMYLTCMHNNSIA